MSSCGALLRTLIAETTSRPEIADAAGLSLAYQTLAELQRSHPAEVVTLLSYPHVGTWLAQVPQRLDAEPDDAPTPLWADCGYLGWLAAAGGIACLPEGSINVVVRNGVVMLPGIGRAELGPAEDNGHCELHRTQDGALRFTRGTSTVLVPSRDDESDPAWLPLRRLRGADAEREVFLDDLDPFRHLLDGQRPPRLTTAQTRTWQQDFAAAWELLRRDFDRYPVPMRSCLQSLAPLSAQPLAASTSHTAFNGVGCVYTTAPADPFQPALTLIHEVQHTKFTLLTDQIVLFDPDPVCRFYAPWRDDPRPIMGLLHGIYAFFGVTDFWRIHRRADCHRSMQANVDFELWRLQVEGAVAQASASSLLTEAGSHFLNALIEEMCPWGEEDVPTAVRVAASEVAIAHRTFWQVRNLTPDIGRIAELATCWIAQAPGPDVLPPADQVDQRAVPNDRRRLHLPAQLKLLDTPRPKLCRPPSSRAATGPIWRVTWPRRSRCTPRSCTSTRSGHGCGRAWHWRCRSSTRTMTSAFSMTGPRSPPTCARYCWRMPKVSRSSMWCGGCRGIRALMGRSGIHTSRNAAQNSISPQIARRSQTRVYTAPPRPIPTVAAHALASERYP
ncbi:HEXXH motif domain-containing protein [Nocardia sp. NPDC050710]|uniref:HEXXH motif domain-containing protein n=1 Tax=Nocardia sp. NPDC050710 TaxID=3157220 RepID=UPI0033D045AB